MNKKYIIGIVSASFAVWYLSELIADTKIREKENQIRIEKEVEKLTVENSSYTEKDPTVPVPFYVVPDSKEEVVPVQVEEPIIPTVTYLPAVNYYDYVNEEVYSNFVAARNRFSYLYQNGEVSSQMSNNGNVLSYDEASTIDYSMRVMYQLLNEYISYYESNQLDACYEKGKEILNYKGIDKQFLFDVLISKKLPEGYQILIDMIFMIRKEILF